MPTFWNCLSKVIDDNLYVFGGFTNETTNHNFYVLNLKTKEWKVYESNIFKNLDAVTQNQNTLIEEKNGFYIIDEYKMFYLDLKTNSIKQYKNKLSKHYPGKFILNDTVYGIFESKTDPKYNFIFEKYPLKKHITNVNDFIVLDQIYYEDRTELYFTISVIFMLLVITIYLIITKKYWFISLIYNTPFIYSIKKDKLFYKGKLVSVLNNYDRLLLEKQILSKNNFFPLSDLNDLFSDCKQQDTMDVLIKRRETKLNGFIKTIAAVSGLSPEKICAFKKHDSDKRIKEIQILPNAITYI
ncbi:kelch repeat-containing protein [Flavobacterium sp.]|uniref:kelch repeat-containing protein n=1 Tax=Flavobacterium sp. TaxID=239 RepID=UPI0033424152